jgi:hypothetical protein
MSLCIGSWKTQNIKTLFKGNDAAQHTEAAPAAQPAAVPVNTPVAGRGRMGDPPPPEAQPLPL